MANKFFKLPGPTALEMVQEVGQEKNKMTCTLGKINLWLHGLWNIQFEEGDTLKEPKFVVKDRELLSFDYVVSHPSFSLRDWGQEEAMHDIYNRFHRGVPRKVNGDYAFLSHIVTILSDRKNRGSWDTTS